MSTELNSITLPDNITTRMKLLLKKTKNNRLEYGFDICEKDNSLIMRNECHGTLCSIELPQGCKTDEKLIGDYHTHPRGTSSLSDSDMHVACRLDFSCIGSSFARDRIICHVRKPDINVGDCREDSFKQDNKNNISNKYFRQIDIL